MSQEEQLKNRIGEYVVGGMIVRVKVESIFIEPDVPGSLWLEIKPVDGHGTTWVNARDVYLCITPSMNLGA